MAWFCHLASIFSNTDDKAEDLAVYCQACIYKFGNSLPIPRPDLKAV